MQITLDERGLRVRDEAYMSLIRHGCKLYDFRIIPGKKVTITPPVVIEDDVYIRADVVMDRYTHIHAGTRIYGRGVFYMREFSVLGYDVHVITSTEDTAGLAGVLIPDKYRNIVIGDVILERFASAVARSMILPGVTFGEGASISIDSVIRHNLEPWTQYVRGKKVGPRDRVAVLSHYEAFLKEIGE